MEAGQILRIVMIAAGVLLSLETILSLAQRRLKEHFCLLWGVISVSFILSGLFLNPTSWSQYVSNKGTVIAVVAGGCVIWCLFFLSIQLSVLSRKNQELAMQVSLLNQENERIMEELAQMRND